jgi:hypothetical protein
MTPQTSRLSLDEVSEVSATTGTSILRSLATSGGLVRLNMGGGKAKAYDFSSKLQNVKIWKKE